MQLVSKLFGFLSEYGLSKKIVSDTRINFVLERFETFCRKVIILQVLSSPYQHQNNGQVEAEIKCIKRTVKKYIEAKTDLNLALLQVRSIPVDAVLLRPATVLFNTSVRGLMP